METKQRNKMNNIGWIKIHRKMLDWQWFGDSRMVQLFLYLLLSASVEEKSWRDIKVGRGQVIVTRKGLADALNMSEQNVRTCLERLKESGEINQQSTNKYTIITICKFDSYQYEEKRVNQHFNQQITNNQPTNNQQTESSPHTPFKGIKERKNKRIYYYSSSRTREEQQQKQFFFIFWLKGAADPEAEYQNFLTWNTTPERAASWERCPDYARYSAARRWVVKGKKQAGYTDASGKAFTELVDIYIQRHPDFISSFVCGDVYPASIKDDRMTITCKEAGAHILENDLATTKNVLRKNGINKLIYKIIQ